MNATNTARYHTVRVSSYVLASCVLLVAALVSGLLNWIPLPSVGPISVQVDLSILAFVLLPVVLTLSVIIRATARTPVEIVLGVFAVPCLFVGLWALYQYFFANPRVYWGGVLTLGAGTILALAVLVDATIEYLA